MASINITDRPNSSRNRTPKKFAKKKGGKIAKTDTKIRKPIFKKNGKLPKLKDAEEKCFHYHEQGH